MKKEKEYGYVFPVIAGILMMIMFLIPNDIVKAFLFGFCWWGLLTVATRLNNYINQNKQ